MDEELFSRQFQVEQKIFYVDVKANKNGKYIKISEKSGGRKHNVLMPIGGLKILREVLEEITRMIDETGGGIDEQ